MVGKLIKHEFLESKRKFIPVIGTIAAATLILVTMIKGGFGSNFLIVTTSFILVGLFFASIVMTIMAFIHVLYTSVYNKRGYQLFTLPVKTWEIIVAKLAITFIWTIIMMLVSGLAILIVFFVALSGNEVMPYISSGFNYLFTSIELRYYAVSLLSQITGTIFTFATFMFVGSIVHSEFVQNRRGLIMFIGFLVLTVIVNNVVALFITSGLPIDFIPNPDAVMNPGMYDPLVSGWESYFTLSTNVQVLQSHMLLAVIKGLLGVGFIFGTIWFWDNKLEIID